MKGSAIDPVFNRYAPEFGAVAQLGERLLCKQGVSGSIPLSSTKIFQEWYSLENLFFDN